MKNTVARRTVAFALALLTVVVFTSCGKKSTDAEETTSHTGTSAIPSFTEESKTDETEETAPVNKDVRISFAAAGDNIGHEAVFTDAKNRANAYSFEYNFVPMYNDIRALIENSDITFINQETVMGGAELSGGKYYGYPDFNSPQDMGKSLVEIGFDVVNIANNHMLDWGVKGLQNTIDFWKTQPVMLLGGYTDEKDYADIRIIESKGVKIAILSYAEMINYAHSSEASGSSLVIPYPKDDVIKTQVAQAKKEADIVLVSIHWGDENVFEPTSNQKRLAKLFADLGVAAVIGHHSHVVQPVEWVEGNNGGKTLVVYSLGNLLSTMLNGKNMVGGIITFDIVKKEGEESYIDNPVFVPTITHYSMNRDSLQIYQLENYSEDLAAAHGCNKNETGFSYARAKQYVTDVISSEFLPEYLK